MTEDRSTDIIREVINIGVGDAAASLSSLVDRRIIITVPEIHVLAMRAISDFVRQNVPALGVYISQDFSDIVAGKALLFYTRECSILLLEALTGQRPVSSSLSQTEIATLQELGNIIMVSCMSTIGDLLEDAIRFEIPEVTEEISEGYFSNMVGEMADLDRAIVVRNDIQVQDAEISGYLFVLVGVSDLGTIVDTLGKRLSP